MDLEHYMQLGSQLSIVNNIVNNTLSSVRNAGLDRLANLIHDEWLPGSIIPDFKIALSAFFRESDFPFFEVPPPFEFDAAELNQKSNMFVMNFKNDILKRLHHTEMINLDKNDKNTIDIMASILSTLVVLSTSPTWHSPFLEKISDLFARILTIELKHWAKRTEEKFSKISIQRFLAQESVTQNEIHKDLEMFPHVLFIRHHMSEKYDSIEKFYKACTYAQARLIDFASDSKFLLQLLSFIVKGEIENGKLFPYVKGIMEDVIVKKVLSHENAESRIAKALQTADYFNEFDRVINGILRVWEISNA
jgi:hypothetical protein